LSTKAEIVTSEATAAVGMVSTTIPIPAGVWEISALHVVLGGSVAVVTVTNAHGNGSVRFEREDQYVGSESDLRQAQRLVNGHCTLLHALVMGSPKIVVGPGRIKSYIIHETSVAHTLTATIRRLLVP
jgi:hypothetical protein